MDRCVGRISCVPPVYRLFNIVSVGKISGVPSVHSFFNIVSVGRIFCVPSVYRLFNIICLFINSAVFVCVPRDGELRTQKLKSNLMRTQSLKVLPLKPGVGQYIAMHAMLTSRDFVLAIFSTHLHFFQSLSRVIPLLAVANTGSCVDEHNKIGHPP